MYEGKMYKFLLSQGLSVLTFNSVPFDASSFICLSIKFGLWVLMQLQVAFKPPSVESLGSVF